MIYSDGLQPFVHLGRSKRANADDQILHFLTAKDFLWYPHYFKGHFVHFVAEKEFLFNKQKKKVLLKRG